MKARGGEALDGNDAEAFKSYLETAERTLAPIEPARRPFLEDNIGFAKKVTANVPAHAPESRR